MDEPGERQPRIDSQPQSGLRRVKIALLLVPVALLATCGLWLTPIEGGERFTALNALGVAIAAGCGISAALAASRAGELRWAVAAVGIVIGVIVGAILILIALIAFASQFE